eukprot:scaffold1048_cov90-Amphora_coffeaeformis.AAC.30
MKGIQVDDGISRVVFPTTAATLIPYPRFVGNVPSVQGRSLCHKGPIEKVSALLIGLVKNGKVSGVLRQGRVFKGIQIFRYDLSIDNQISLRSCGRRDEVRNHKNGIHVGGRKFEGCLATFNIKGQDDGMGHGFPVGLGKLWIDALTILGGGLVDGIPRSRPQVQVGAHTLNVRHVVFPHIVQVGPRCGRRQDGCRFAVVVGIGFVKQTGLFLLSTGLLFSKLRQNGIPDGHQLRYVIKDELDHGSTLLMLRTQVIGLIQIQAVYPCSGMNIGIETTPGITPGTVEDRRGDDRPTSRMHVQLDSSSFGRRSSVLCCVDFDL